MMQVSETGGEAQPLTTGDDAQVRWIDSLPDGKGVLFTLWGGLNDSRIAVQSPDMTQPIVLAEGTHPTWVPTGHIVFARQPSSLWAVPFDLERLSVVGEPTPVLEGVQVNPGGFAQYALSDDGTIAYRPPGISRGSGTLVWVSLSGVEEATALPPRDYNYVSLSPEGTRAAVEITDGARTEVWVAELSRGTLIRITDNSAFDTNPMWSPDGQRILFASNRNGPFELLWKSADGTGDVEVLTSFAESVREIRPYSWTPDGTTVAVAVASASTGPDIGLVSANRGGEWEPLVQTPASEFEAAISPNGETGRVSHR